MKKKLIKLLAIVLTIVLGTVGCAKENKNEDSNEEINEYNIQESNYIHLTMLFPKTINPILNRDKSVGYIMNLIYDGLFEIDENYNVEPRLVETYTKSSDGKSINIKLKSDATWHNNKELTSSDVNFTVDLIKKIKDNPYSDLVGNIKSIQINDSKNFTINLNENDPFIIEKLTFPIVSKDKLSSLKTDEVNKYKNNLLGNGPYKIKEYVDRRQCAKYFEGKGIWNIKADVVLPCATQNDINLDDAKKIVENGTFAVGEGANMPCTNEAVEYFLEKGVLLAPAKAANAGGVATSALEMSQNSMRLSWSFEEVDQKLHDIMVNIFKNSRDAAKEYGFEGNYVVGANIAGFIKVADAIVAQGLV